MTAVNFYKISSANTEKAYIGSTEKDIAERLKRHEIDYTRYQDAIDNLDKTTKKRLKKETGNIDKITKSIFQNTKDNITTITKNKSINIKDNIDKITKNMQDELGVGHHNRAFSGYPDMRSGLHYREIPRSDDPRA
jgi:hypothetical protein